MDKTETIRKQMVAEINPREEGRAELEERYGQVWNGKEVGEHFEMLGFGAPFVHVRRKSDGVEGSLMFQHNPRLYFSFQPKD